MQNGNRLPYSANRSLHQRKAAIISDTTTLERSRTLDLGQKILLCMQNIVILSCFECLPTRVWNQRDWCTWSTHLVLFFVQVLRSRNSLHIETDLADDAKDCTSPQITSYSSRVGRSFSADSGVRMDILSNCKCKLHCILEVQGPNFCHAHNLLERRRIYLLNCVRSGP